MSAKRVPGLREAVAGVAEEEGEAVSVEVAAGVEALAAVVVGEADAGHSRRCSVDLRLLGGWLCDTANLHCFTSVGTRLTHYLHAVKSLCQFEIFPLSHDFMVLLKSVLKVGRWQVRYLALMATQCCYLEVESVSDIGAVIYLLGAPEQYFFDLMGLKPVQH